MALDTKTRPLATSRRFAHSLLLALLYQNRLAYLTIGANSERLVGMLVVGFAS
jgi:hypothetical protein